VFVVLVPSIGE